MGDLAFLNSVIQERLRHYHLELGVKQRQSVSLWAKVAGDSVAAVTEASDVRDGVLWVFTRSSAWSQELSLMKEPLIARLNAELGADVVHDIRFKVKRMPKPKAEATEPAAAPSRDLTPEERASLEAITNRLDPDLGRRIASVAEKQMRAQAASRVCPTCGGPLHRNETTCPFCRAPERPRQGTLEPWTGDT